MHLNGKYREPYSHSVEPILLQIARDTGETRSEIRHLTSSLEESRKHVQHLDLRVQRLETRKSITTADIMPWLYGLAVLAATATGKVKLEAALAMLGR